MAAADLQERVRSDPNFEWLDHPSYTALLDDLFDLISEDEVLVESGVSWETRTANAQTDGRVSFFVLTNRAIYFPVTEKRLMGRNHKIVSVASDSVGSGTTRTSEHGFPSVDFFDRSGKLVAGLTLHPMADPEGYPTGQLNRLASQFGVELPHS